MTKTIYIVVGASGSYDDFSTWMVKAFTSKKAAERHRSSCFKGYEEALARYNKNSDAYLLKDPVNRADPKMEFRPRDTRYLIERLLLIED